MKFKLFNVQISISVFFALGICLAVISESMASLLFVIFSSLLHELAHLVMLMSYGEKPKELRFGIFGVEIRRGDNLQLSYQQEVAMVLAGPLANLLLAIILIALKFILKSDFFLLPAMINLALAALNLLPISPLDGGQALYFLLCTRLDEEQALALVEKIGIFTLFPLFLVGFSVLIQSGYNYSLLAVCLYLSVFFIFENHSSPDRNTAK